jgi:hypothetical protein
MECCVLLPDATQLSVSWLYYAMGMIDAMRAHSSPMRAYLLDAMVYDVMYARFPVARAKKTLSSLLAEVERKGEL